MRLAESSIPKGKSEVKQRNDTKWKGSGVSGWECSISTGTWVVSSLSGFIFVICPLATGSGILNSQCACPNELGCQK